MSPGWVAASVIVVDTGRSDPSATLASVLAQTEPPEVIFATPASSAEERLAGCGTDASRCRVVHRRDAALADLMQAGLEASSGLYVKYVLPGDVLDPSCIARQLEVLSDYPQPPATCRSVRRAHEAPAEPDAWQGDVTADLLRRLLRGEAPPLASLLVRRSALDDCGGVDATYLARPDFDLWLRLLQDVAVRGDGDALPAIGDEIDRHRSHEEQQAERGRAQAALFARLGTDGVVRVATRASWGDPIAERIELARRLVTSKTDEGRLLAHRLLGEARALGASRPQDDGTLRDLLCAWPEHDVPVLPPALRARAAGMSLLDASSGPEPARAAALPPRLCLAVWWEGAAQPGGAELLRHAAALRAHAVDVLCLVAGDAPDLPRDGGFAVEVVRSADVQPVFARIAERWRVAALIADASLPIAAAARAEGCLLPSELPPAVSGDAEPAALAHALRRWIAGCLAAQRTEKACEAQACRDERLVQETREEAWRVAGAGLRDPATSFARFAMRDGTDARRLEVVASERRAAKMTWLAGQLRLRAEGLLEKLRLGHRARQSMLALRRRLAVTEAHSRTGAEQRVESFIAAAVAARASGLWVVYATDPYSETRGQRSTWLAQELARRDARVVYFYWRWDPKEEIPATGDDRVLAVPIDQFQDVRGELCAAPGEPLPRFFLAEFPDWMLFERMDLFAAHGFVTIYDCIDDWSEFARAGQAHWYDADVERHLARNADVVVATHPLLAEKLQGMSQRSVAVVPNGVRLDDLRPPQRARDAAAPPVIGYFGHLTASWFDWELVVASARRNPDWRFEIIGYGEPADLSLPANVALLGRVEHAALAARTAGWSIAMIPFRETELSRAVDPVKLYEYLALELPVVAVGMPFLADVPGVAVCDPATFDAAIVERLRMPFERERVAAFVAGSTWARRVDRLVELARGVERPADVVKALVA